MAAFFTTNKSSFTELGIAPAAAVEAAIPLFKPSLFGNSALLAEVYPHFSKKVNGNRKANDGNADSVNDPAQNSVQPKASKEGNS